MVIPAIMVAVATAISQVSSIPIQTTSDIQFIYLVVGVALITSGVIDLIWTTLWVDSGAGPLTASLMANTWRGLRTFEHRRSRILSLSGPLVLTLTLVMWILLLWVGWTLIFASDPNALNYTRGPEPVSWLGRIYFVAYTMFTMGNGDFSPASGTWRIVTALTNGSGMILLTLSVTYVINVLQAVVKARSFASSVRGVGKRGETFVRTGWNGNNLTEHDLPLDTFMSQLGTIASQHEAYPILHYYRSKGQRHSTPIAVAVFDDALTLLRYGVSQQDRPNKPLVETARSSVEDYLQSVYGLPVQSADHLPPNPDLSALQREGIPTVSADEFDEALDKNSDRRRRLLGVVESQAWQWPSDGDTRDEE